MPGTNAGTGQPLTLRCSWCKRSHRDDPERGTKLLATGRFKAARHRSIRQTNRKIEYYCQDCGHHGWTQHIDAEKLVARKAERQAQIDQMRRNERGSATKA